MQNRNLKKKRNLEKIYCAMGGTLFTFFDNIFVCIHLLVDGVIIERERERELLQDVMHNTTVIHIVFLLHQYLYSPS